MATPEPNRAEPHPAAPLRTMWERHDPAVLEWLDLLEHAVAALQEGVLDVSHREQASTTAHRLARSLDRFGLRAAAEDARRVALLFACAEPLGAAQVAMLAPLVGSIGADVRSTAAPVLRAAVRARSSQAEASS